MKSTVNKIKKGQIEDYISDSTQAALTALSGVTGALNLQQVLDNGAQAVITNLSNNLDILSPFLNLSSSFEGSNYGSNISLAHNSANFTNSYSDYGTSNVHQIEMRLFSNVNGGSGIIEYRDIINSLYTGLAVTDDGVTIYDSSAEKGLSYQANYATNNTSNPRWVPDKEYVDNAIAAGGGSGTTPNLQSVLETGSFAILNDTTGGTPNNLGIIIQDLTNLSAPKVGAIAVNSTQVGMQTGNQQLFVRDGGASDGLTYYYNSKRFQIDGEKTEITGIPANYANEDSLRFLMYDDSFIPSIGRVKELIATGASSNLQGVLDGGPTQGIMTTGEEFSITNNDITFDTQRSIFSFTPQSFYLESSNTDSNGSGFTSSFSFNGGYDIFGDASASALLSSEYNNQLGGSESIIFDSEITTFAFNGGASILNRITNFSNGSQGTREIGFQGNDSYFGMIILKDNIGGWGARYDSDYSPKWIEIETAGTNDADRFIPDRGEVKRLISEGGGSSSGRFGIEDNSSDVNRAMNMSGNNFSVSGASEFNFIGGAVPQYFPYNEDYMYFEPANTTGSPDYDNNSFFYFDGLESLAGFLPETLNVHITIDDVDGEYTFSLGTIFGDVVYSLSPQLEGTEFVVTGVDVPINRSMSLFEVKNFVIQGGVLVDVRLMNDFEVYPFFRTNIYEGIPAWDGFSIVSVESSYNYDIEKYPQFIDVKMSIDGVEEIVTFTLSSQIDTEYNELMHRWITPEIAGTDVFPVSFEKITISPVNTIVALRDGEEEEKGAIVRINSNNELFRGTPPTLQEVLRTDSNLPFDSSTYDIGLGTDVTFTVGPEGFGPKLSLNNSNTTGVVRAGLYLNDGGSYYKGMLIYNDKSFLNGDFTLYDANKSMMIENDDQLPDSGFVKDGYFTYSILTGGTIAGIGQYYTEFRDDFVEAQLGYSGTIADGKVMKVKNARETGELLIKPYAPMLINGQTGFTLHAGETVELMGHFDGVTTSWSVISHDKPNRSITGGIASFTGDDATTSFMIEHGLGRMPISHSVTRNSDVTGNLFQTSADETHITVTFIAGAPMSGNVTLVNWLAFV